MVDVIIPVKNQGRHEELRYALRSIENNFVYNNIFIAGHKPRWLINTQHIYRDQSKTNYRANAFLNIQMAVNHKDTSEQLVISHDDIYFLRPISHIPLEHGLRLIDQPWARRLPQTLHLLKKLGVYSRWSWEHHIPALVEKDKLRYILGVIRREYPNNFDRVQWRSIYYNYFNIKGEQTNDVKTFGEPILKDGQLFLSTQDYTFKSARPFLKSLFPNKSSYEK